MKKLNPSNTNHFIFLLAIICDVFFLYNLIQYIRYGHDTYLNGFLMALGIGIILLFFLWKNNYFPQNKNESMKKDK